MKSKPLTFGEGIQRGKEDRAARKCYDPQHETPREGERLTENIGGRLTQAAPDGIVKA